MAFSDRLRASNYYDRDAAAFAARYDSVSFDAVHPLLSRYLPASGRALDIGAGSGRDAMAMAALGLDVTAVEPSGALRAIGSAKSDAIRWIDDYLPRLSRLDEEAECYDFVLCSAVLMLLPPCDVGPSLARMAGLLAGQGRLAINLRSPRSGEPAELFYAHQDADVLAAAKAAGLRCIDCGESNDAIGRGYRWRSFVFERVQVDIHKGASK